jgi:hypothetical protein
MGLPVILTHETEERNSQRVCLAIVSHITSKSSSNLAYYEAHICISHANIEIDKTVVQLTSVRRRQKGSRLAQVARYREDAGCDWIECRPA